MKKFVMLFLLASTWLSACSGDDTESIEPEPSPVVKNQIDIDKASGSELSGEAVSGSLLLQVVSSSDWSLTLADTRGAIDWITPSSTRGQAGKTEISLTVEENATPTTRTAYIKFANSTKSVTITYTQQKYAEANLTLSLTEISVEYEAVSKTFTLKSELPWTLTSSDESFCTVTPIRGNPGTHTITVSITENTSVEKKRTAILTACSGYEQTTVSVTQDRKNPVLNIDRGIKSLDDLCRFRDAVNSGESLSEWKYNGEINLLTDIDLSYIDNWVPIGAPEKTGFTETFNGNGFTLSNVTIKYDSKATGFFGWNYGTIKNLNLSHIYIQNKSINGQKHATGGIAGYSCYYDDNEIGGRIRNCSVDGFIYADCSSASLVNGVGGICGYMNPSSEGLSDCTNYAIVLAEGWSIANGIASGSNINWESCKDEGLNSSTSFPISLYELLTSKSVLTQEKAYTKEELFAALKETDKVLPSLNISVNNPVLVEILKIKDLTIKGSFEELDLNQNTSLIRLDCHGCRNLTNLDIDKCTNLTGLNCSSCALVDLFLKNGTKLTSLDCSGNKLTSLDLTNNTKLTSLDCSNNALASIDLSQNMALNYVNYTLNPSKSLDLSNHKLLDSLKYNNIESLNLHGCSKLKKIAIDRHTSTLDLSDCTSIELIALQSQPAYSRGKLTTLNLKQCYNLKHISVPFCRLQTIDLTSCRSLSTLDVSSNQITQLDLSNNSNLNYIYCSNNTIYRLDLSRLTNLKIVECSDNEISNLDLSGLLQLTSIHCYSNQLSTLDLSNIPTLTAFFCGTQKNNITLLLSLSEKQNSIWENDLKYASTNLNVKLANEYHFIQISDANFKKYLISTFDQNNDGIIGYTEAESITRIDCNSHNIQSLQGLENFSNLEYLSCRNNHLKSLDLSNNHNLTTLDCGNNQLTTLDLSNNIDLITLDCSSNLLKSLDLSYNRNLTTFDCRGNQFTILDLSSNIDLITLDCSSNLLKSLDLSNNCNLTRLDCSNNAKISNILLNKMESLNLTGCSQLEILNCSNCYLKELDIKDCASLKNLFCYKNSIDNLNITNCINLETENITGSAITSNNNNSGLVVGSQITMQGSSMRSKQIYLSVTSSQKELWNNFWSKCQLNTSVWVR